METPEEPETYYRVAGKIITAQKPSELTNVSMTSVPVKIFWSFLIGLITHPTQI